MNRTTFIKNLIGLFGVGALPKALVKQYQKVYLLQCFVRGFRFHQGPKLLEQMTVGQLLELQREPQNEHDACAIALYCGPHMIGYIPREENEILSRLMDAQLVELLAEITHIEPKAQAWEHVAIAVYVLKEITNEPLPETASYLTTIESPNYRTLRSSNDRLTRVSYAQPALHYERKEILTADDFYTALEEHSKDGSVYGLIHEGINTPQKMELAVQESRIIINRNRLPQDLQLDDVVKALDDEIVNIDGHFAENGYVVANIDRLAELSARIQRFTEVTDNEGRLFFDAIMQ